MTITRKSARRSVRDVVREALNREPITIPVGRIACGDVIELVLFGRRTACTVVTVVEFTARGGWRRSIRLAFTPRGGGTDLHTIYPKPTASFPLLALGAYRRK